MTSFVKSWLVISALALSGSTLKSACEAGDREACLKAAVEERREEVLGKYTPSPQFKRTQEARGRLDWGIAESVIALIEEETRLASELNAQLFPASQDLEPSAFFDRLAVSPNALLRYLRENQDAFTCAFRDSAFQCDVSGARLAKLAQGKAGREFLYERERKVAFDGGIKAILEFYGRKYAEAGDRKAFRRKTMKEIERHLSGIPKDADGLRFAKELKEEMGALFAP